MEKGVERLHPLHEHREVEGHRLSVQLRRSLEVAAEATLPEEDTVASLGIAVPAPL